MKFPSIDYVAEQAWKSLNRFYMPLFFAFCSCVIAIMMVENKSDDNTLYTKLLLTSIISIPFSLGCILFAERTTRNRKGLMESLTVLFAIVYCLFYSPDTFFDDLKETIIYLVLIVVVHLWVALAAYINKGERYGFWRFNESMYARMIISAIFSVVLYGGLALALAAVNILFKFDVNERMYLDIWIVIVSIFNTWFFLSGIPEDYEVLNTEKIFPKGLKIFTQYILIPLATLYLLILYAYGLKILVQWSLPKGWVSMLIMCYSVIGILAVLLVYPLRDDAENAWVRFFARFFFIAILPLIVLLFVAIGVRVRQYGITEPRYYLMLLGLWLAFIALYNIFSGQKNIKVIPASLAVIGVLSLIGPWNVFSVSERSQLSRLEKLLAQYNIHQSGSTITQPNKTVSADDIQHIQSILEYFVDRKDVPKLQHIYPTDLKKLNAYISNKHKNEEIESRLWLEKAQMNDTLVVMLHIERAEDVIYYQNSSHSFTIDDDICTDVSGYRYIYDYHYYDNNNLDHVDKSTVIHISESDSIRLIITNQRHEAYITIDRLGELQCKIDLNTILDTLEKNDKRHSDIPSSRMTAIGIGIRQSKIIIKQVIINSNKEENRIGSIDAYILFN